MTTETSLFPAPDGAGVIPGLPDCFSDPEDSARIIVGIPVWWEADGDEPGYEVLYVHTHDERKALEIAERMRMASEFDAIGSPEITQSGWCRLVTVCGCTPEQHAEHVRAWEEEEEVEQCAGCKHPGLGPCDAAPIYAFSLETVAAGTPGALPYLRIELS